MSGKFSMDDYVDVAERIQSFYLRFPEGRLTSGEDPQLLEAGGKTFIVYHAKAYRDPEDQFPGDGWAWEPVPGPTQFTKDSELQNAETAAWGRAIVALGFETKKIASKQEVRNRTAEPPVAAAAPLAGFAGFADHEKIETLIARLDEVAPKKDGWRTWTETQSVALYKHKLNEVTVTEAEKIAVFLQGELDKAQVAA